ncbi:hypothetical protein P12x_005633 [Tundrisphaera lichenicola]|uniref:hypothetical protein n=1 Tax=Tundrisphaera lichenicola TaxID=2029860 RepID=UPI003EB87483
MIALTVEQHRAIEDAGGSPVRVEDLETKTTYVLVNADLYERIRALIEPDEPTPEEFAPLIWDAMKGDWDDPSMDAYDRYPERP